MRYKTKEMTGLNGWKSTINYIILLLQGLRILATVHAECQVVPEVLYVSQVGPVRVSLRQHVVFSCEAIATAGVFWFYNGVHISENSSPNLDMKESETLLVDPLRCIRQKNLTVFITPETDKIYLDCRAVALYSPIIATSLPINITVEGVESVSILSTYHGYQPTTVNVFDSSVAKVNYVKLSWRQPFTSDNPQSLYYKVSVINDNQNELIFKENISETEIVIPASELSTCCVYSCSVRAKTENFTSNLTSISIPCSKFPPSVSVEMGSLVVSILKSTARVTVSVTIPDPECPQQHSNLTAVAFTEQEGLENSILVKEEFAIQNPAKYCEFTFEVERNHKYKSVVLLSNTMGYGESNGVLTFSTHAIQNISISFAANRDVCFEAMFAVGSVEHTKGCHVTLNGEKNVEFVIDTRIGTHCMTSLPVGNYTMIATDILPSDPLYVDPAFTTTLEITGSTTHLLSTDLPTESTPTVSVGSTPLADGGRTIDTIPIITIIVACTCFFAALLAIVLVLVVYHRKRVNHLSAAGVQIEGNPSYESIIPIQRAATLSDTARNPAYALVSIRQ